MFWSVADLEQIEEYTSVDQQLSLSPLHSPLRLGNSDPFDSQSIPIGPYEYDLLKVYREFALQSLGRGAAWKVGNLDVVHMTCLSDKAATFALLARNSAVRALRSGVNSTEMSTVQLGYLTGAQAGLRKNLALMTGSRTRSMIHRVLWTTCLLAYAEMIHGSPTAGVHVRAMSQLLLKYTELMGDQVNKSDIIAVAIIDFVRACRTLTRPTIDMIDWFPSMFREIWDTTGLYRIEQASKDTQWDSVHQAIRDKRLRAMIVDQREEQEKCRALLEVETSREEATVRGHSVHSRQLYQKVQLLHIFLDAMERFEAPRMSVEQRHDQVSRAYVSLAVLLWVNIASPISFTTERLLDGTGRILQHMRNILTQDRGDATMGSSIERYRDARLWALCIGVQTERHREEQLGLVPACGGWFFEAFDAELRAMRVRSWQQVVDVSEQFLSLEGIKPHISCWWHTVNVDGGVGRRESVEPLVLARVEERRYVT